METTGAIQPCPVNKGHGVHRRDLSLRIESSVDTKFGARAKEIFTKVWPPNAVIFDAVSLGIQTLTSISGFWGPLGSPKSRPIGLARVSPGNDSEATWPPGSPLILGLTYESAEYLVKLNDSGAGPGVIVRKYVDDPHLQGDYDIYLRLYKTGGDDTNEAEELVNQSKTYRVEATGQFLADGGATICRFIPTNSDSEDILASVCGWQPGAGSHPTSMFVKRGNQSGQAGIWFRLNFVNDVANGIVWISFYQGGSPAWGVAVQPSTVAFNAQPWH